MKPAYITTITTAIAAIVLLAFSPVNAHAGNRQVGGFVLGGGSGAIAGNEIERNQRSAYHPSQVIAHSQRYDNRYDNHRYNSRIPRPVFRDHNRNNHYRNDDNRGYSHDRYDKRNCRKIVTIQKGYYGTKRVISTVCGTSHRYPYKKHNSFGFNDRFHR